MYRFVVDTINVLAIVALGVAVMFGLEFSVEMYARMVDTYVQAMTDLVVGL
jgi:hypothetical protein